MLLAIRRFRLFDGIGHPAVDHIARASQCQTFAANEAIYRQGETPEALYLVAGGHVRLAIVSPEGDEKVIDILSPGRHFGLAEVFATAQHDSFAETITPAEIISVDKRTLLREVALSPELSRNALVALSRQYAGIVRDLTASHFESVGRRLLNYLLGLADGDHQVAPGCEIELPISKRHIAARLGTTPESLSRALRELTELGLIGVHGRRIRFLAPSAFRQVRSI